MSISRVVGPGPFAVYAFCHPETRVVHHVGRKSPDGVIRLPISTRIAMGNAPHFEVIAEFADINEALNAARRAKALVGTVFDRNAFLVRIRVRKGEWSPEALAKRKPASYSRTKKPKRERLPAGWSEKAPPPDNDHTLYEMYVERERRRSLVTASSGDGTPWHLRVSSSPYPAGYLPYDHQPVVSPPNLPTPKPPDARPTYDEPTVRFVDIPQCALVAAIRLRTELHTYAEIARQLTDQGQPPGVVWQPADVRSLIQVAFTSWPRDPTPKYR